MKIKNCMCKKNYILSYFYWKIIKNLSKKLIFKFSLIVNYLIYY